MTPRKIWKRMQNRVRADRMDSRFDDAPCVAIIAGNCVVIEAIVQMAVLDSGIEMDWHYIGGRGVVRSHGDRVRCRFALRMASPQGDLDERDLVVAK